MILVEGRTNLPDGALLSVAAARTFRFQHGDEVRTVTAATESATVSGGRFSTWLTVDEGDLLVDLDYEIKDPQTGPIAVVDNAVTVCTEFRTGEDFSGKPSQPDETVSAIVGPSGEQLKDSPQATEFGSATPTPAYWLEVVDRVAMKSPLLDEIANVQSRRPRSARIAGFCAS